MAKVERPTDVPNLLRYARQLPQWVTAIGPPPARYHANTYPWVELPEGPWWIQDYPEKIRVTCPVCFTRKRGVDFIAPGFEITAESIAERTKVSEMPDRILLLDSFTLIGGPLICDMLVVWAGLCLKCVHVIHTSKGRRIGQEHDDK